MKMTVKLLFFIQLLLSIILITVTLYCGYYWCESVPVPASTDISVRLYYTLRCSFPMLLTLAFAVMTVSNKRGSNPKLINPLLGNDGLMQVDKNYLQNTLEQLCISLPLLVIATTYFDTHQLITIVPLYSLLFVTARVLFRIGYGLGPQYRSLGMLTNIISTWLLICFLVYLMYTKGLMYGLGSVAYPKGSVPMKGNGYEEL